MTMTSEERAREKAKEIVRETDFDGLSAHQLTDAITSAILAEREAAAPKWRTMDSAPKDGTRILVWCIHEQAKYCDDPVADGYAGPVIANWSNFNNGGWTWYGLCGSFTAWMPLPPAPEHPPTDADGGAS